MSAQACASDAGARDVQRVRGPQRRCARAARASARLPRRLVSRETSRATVAVSVSTGGRPRCSWRRTPRTDDVVDARDASDEPRVYVDADRVAGPRLADADSGEHAAAFLSGNFQPLTEELTAVVETGGPFRRRRRARDRGPERQLLRGVRGVRRDRLSLSDAPEEMRVAGRLPAGFPTASSHVGPNPAFGREHYKKWGTRTDQPNVGFGDGWHHWFEGDGMVYAMDLAEREAIGRRRAPGGAFADDPSVSSCTATGTCAPNPGTTSWRRERGCSRR